MKNALGGKDLILNKTATRARIFITKQPKMQDNLNRTYPRDFVMIRND